MIILILVRRIQRFLDPVEVTHNNSGNKYHNWLNLKNNVPSDRAWSLLELIPRFCVRFLEGAYGMNYCYMVTNFIF